MRKQFFIITTLMISMYTHGMDQLPREIFFLFMDRYVDITSINSVQEAYEEFRSLPNASTSCRRNMQFIQPSSEYSFDTNDITLIKLFKSYHSVYIHSIIKNHSKYAQILLSSEESSDESSGSTKENDIYLWPHKQQKTTSKKIRSHIWTLPSGDIEYDIDPNEETCIEYIKQWWETRTEEEVKLLSSDQKDIWLLNE